MNGIATTIDRRANQNATTSRHWASLFWGGCLGVAIALSPLVSWAQSNTIVYRGSGQIVSGQGHGARLQLVLELSNGRIRTRSGPPLDASFSGGSQTFQNSEGTWQIDRRGNRLDVTLYRDSQVIRYQLEPDNKDETSPRADADEDKPEGGLAAGNLSEFGE